MMKLVRTADAARLAGVLALVLTCGAVHAETKPTPAAPAAPAPVSAEPQNTSASYGDWTVHCQRANDTAPRVCELEQSLQVQGQQSPIAQIAVGRPSFKDPMKIVVTLPSFVSFPSTVKLALDEKDTQPVELTWRKCMPGGCAADTDFKDEDIKKWKTQTANGRLQFKDGNGREEILPFSFRGFAQAMDGLAKSAP